MNEDLKKYVERIKKRLMDREEMLNVYYKDGRKLVKLFSSNSRKTIIQQLKDYVNEYEQKEGDEYILIAFGAQTKSFLHGPIFINCSIIVVNSKLNININSSKGSSIRYTIHDLETRGYKNGDYKRLYNKMKKGLLLDSKKIYTAKFLDDK